MFSISLYLWHYLMAENQPRIKRTVLFVNVSSSLSCRNLGSSGPKLHRLVIHPFLGLPTDNPLDCVPNYQIKQLATLCTSLYTHTRQGLAKMGQNGAAHISKLNGPNWRKKRKKLCLAEFSAICEFISFCDSYSTVVCLQVSKGKLMNISKKYYCISTQTRANASDGEMLSHAMG
jgi:hypothetical protein